MANIQDLYTEIKQKHDRSKSLVVGHIHIFTNILLPTVKFCQITLISNRKSEKLKLTDDVENLLYKTFINKSITIYNCHTIFTMLNYRSHWLGIHFTILVTLFGKVEKQKPLNNTAFLHCLAPCSIILSKKKTSHYRTNKFHSSRYISLSQHIVLEDVCVPTDIKLSFYQD